MGINNYDRRLKQCARTIIELDKRLSKSDIVCYGVINRSLNIVRGFNQLIESNNYIAAISLMRMQLDCSMRMCALVIDSSCSVADHILLGNKLKDYNGEEGKFTDYYLKNKIVENFPNIDKLYNFLSSYVHFDKHLAYRIINRQDAKRFSVRIGAYDFYQDDEKEYILECMTDLCFIFLFYIEKYKEKKQNC